jgi:pimeloyl-ACP methyl ester carboxylesterase
MRISHKSRFTTLVGAAALVVASLSIAPARAAAAGPLCDGKSPIQSCQGTTSDGAPYAMQVPANFNGTVLLWSHGYRPNVAVPVGIPGYGGYTVTNTPETAGGQSSGNMAPTQTLLSQGYALMGSGFARQGWNLDSALATNVELIDTFKKKFTSTKHVVAWGGSLGGIITQALAEKYPTLVDAVAPLCMADNVNAELTMAGDFLWGTKVLFNPAIKGGNYSAGIDGYKEAMNDLKLFFGVIGELKAGITQTDATKSWPSTSSATGKALAAAGVPSRSALLLLGLMAGIPTQSPSFDSVAGPEGPLKLTFPLAVSPALAVLENGANAGALAILALSDVEAQAGGAVFDNTKTDYAARVADSSVIFNAALSGNTAIAAMLGALSPANPGAPRAVGNAAAIAKMNSMVQTTGKINVPTIFMTGVADPITPAGATQRILDKYVDQYEAAKAAAAKASYNGGTFVPAKSKVLTLWSVTPKTWTKFDAAGSPVSQANIPGTGHCTFTAANLNTVSKILVESAVTGQINLDGATRTAVRKSRGLLIDPNYRAPLLKYYGE